MSKTRISKVYLPFFVLTLFLLSSLACSSGGGDDGDTGSDIPGDSTPDDSPPPSGNTRSLRITTINVGLFPGIVPLANERVGAVASSLAGHDADILCVQELWRASDEQRVTTAVRANFPFVFNAAAQQKFASRSPVCTLGELEPLATCLFSNCFATSREFFECATNECLAPLDELAQQNPECVSAIYAQAGRGASETLDIQSQLLSEDARTGLYAFGGASGTLIYSKLPLVEQQVLDFFDISTATRRVALFASVEIAGIRHRVSCSHLTSNLGAIPYTGSFGSWENEALTETQALLNFAENYAAGSPLYLAGDFNCSLSNAATGVTSDFAAVCARIIGAGYRDLAGESLGCSFCSSNPINQRNASLVGNANLLLDHVFTRNLVFAADGVSLQFTEPLAVGGRSTSISDHYGVRLTVPVPQ